MTIVIFDNPPDFRPKVIESKRYRSILKEFLFECFDEPFDNGDATMLADGSETKFNGFILGPLFIAVAPELRTFVGDNVLRYSTFFTNSSIQEVLNLVRIRLFVEDGKPDDTP